MSKRLHAPPAQEATYWPPLRPAALPASPLSPVVRDATQSGGRALDRKTEAQMSARFGHSFSDIRVHTDHHAGASAQALGANAYTVGSDIVFGAGQYQPGSSDTERLLAHELTHAVQQAQHGPGDPSRVSRKDDASEREADVAASQVMTGRNVPVSAAPGAAVARDESELACRAAALHDNPLAILGMMGLPGGSSPYESRKEESPWKSFTENPIWDVGTHDTTGAMMGLGVNKLDPIAEEAARAAPISDLNMQQFRLNHPELTPLGADSSAEARAAQMEGWKANSVEEATAREAAGPMQPLGRSAEEGEEALEAASRWKTPLKGLGALKLASRVASPFSAYSDYTSMMEDWQKGEHADAVADGLGLTSSAIGTVDAVGAGLSFFGAAGAGGAVSSLASTLNPIGAVAGSAAGGYAGGKLALNKANQYAKKHEIFGKGDDGEARDSTGAAADAGVAVKDAVTDFDIGGYQLPGQKYIGDFAGGVTSVVGSWGTAGYSGLHALGSGIKNDAGWLWDHTFGDSGPSDEEMADNQRMANAAMTENADARMHAEIQEELYGSHSSVAHEEMPPLPPKEERRR